MIRAASAALAAVLLCAGCSTPPIDGARAKNLEIVEQRTAAALEKQPRGWIAVQDGEVVAVAPAPDDAARMAAARGRTRHRFVYRAANRGPRLHRLVYLPEGGLVAGRGFLEDVGFRVVSAGLAGPGRQVIVERQGARRTIDLSQSPRLRVELRPLAGGDPIELDVPFEPDFDGPLLLPEDGAAALDLELAEIPGVADVQVALGRPFAARRAWAWARVPSLGVTGPVQVLVRAQRPAR